MNNLKLFVALRQQILLCQCLSQLESLDKETAKTASSLLKVNIVMSSYEGEEITEVPSLETSTVQGSRRNFKRSCPVLIAFFALFLETFWSKNDGPQSKVMQVWMMNKCVDLPHWNLGYLYCALTGNKTNSHLDFLSECNNNTLRGCPFKELHGSVKYTSV